MPRRHSPHPDAPFLNRPPRPPGRPAKPADEVLLSYTIRLCEADRNKLHALGGRKWVERQLSRVKATSA
jgi:hypothetical protein